MKQNKKERSEECWSRAVKLDNIRGWLYVKRYSRIQGESGGQGIDMICGELKGDMR